MNARAGQHSSAGGRRGRKKRLFDDWILNTRQIARIEFLLFASNTQVKLVRQRSTTGNPRSDE